MAKRTNVFTTHFQELINTLALLNLEMHVASNEFTKLAAGKQKGIEAYRSKTDVASNALIVGKTVVLNGYDPFSKEARMISYQSASVSNETLIAFFEEIAGRVRGQAFCGAFEALERFLRQLVGDLYFAKRKSWPLAKKNAFHKERSKWSKKPDVGLPEYFGDYVEWLTRRNCDDLLAELRRRLPELEAFGANYRWGHSDVFLLWKLCGECRHIIVHNLGRCEDSDLKPLDPDVRKWLKKLLRQSVISEGSAILPSEDATKELIRGMADFAYLVYKTATDECELHSDFTPAGWKLATNPSKA